MERTQEQDLYEVLQVSPRAHPLIITKAFRLLAALYHPDNTQTGDEGRFKELGHAYSVLSDPERRAAYDREHAVSTASTERLGSVLEDEPQESANHRTGDEAEMRHVILRALYDVRRRQPYKPGLSLMVLAELVGCSIEQLQYTLWYLRGKRYIDTTNDSDLVITVDGVDYLEANGVRTGEPQSGERTTAALPLPSPPEWTPEASLAPAGAGNGNGSRRGR
jgi:hypothetical protein